MKAFLLIVAMGVCLLSCKKGELVSPGLFGKWELRRLYGGIYWRDSTYKPGNGTIYQFNSDSTYQYFDKGKLVESGVFHFRKNNYPVGNGQYMDAILFNESVYGELISIKDTKMTLGTTMTDGIATDYVKVSN